MSELITWSGLAAAGWVAVNRFWAVIERPLLEFLTLGVIPGTSFAVGYEQALLISLVLFLILLAIEHLSHSLSPEAKRRLLEQLAL
jgi:hypothetical protein